LGGDTDGGDEQLGAALDDDLDKFTELSLGVIIVRLAGASTDLREQKVDTEWRVLVVQVALELSELLLEHLWGVTDASNHTNTTSVGHGGSELRSSSDVHAGKHDGVPDLQEIRRDGANLLRRSHLVGRRQMKRG